MTQRSHASVIRDAASTNIRECRTGTVDSVVFNDIDRKSAAE